MTKTALKNEQFNGDAFSFEEEFSHPLCGIDEVGRGPLAGPVLSACVHIPRDVLHLDFWRQITDSKKLTQKKREALFPLIRQHSYFGIGRASVEEIDELNIHHATLLAMRRAYEHMLENHDMRPQTALIDGKFTPNIECNNKHAVVKGDSKSLSIAAASILAKVMRDRMMAELHKEFPHYGWNSNAGYGTVIHMDGLREHGVTPHHRRSFAPVREALAL